MAYLFLTEYYRENETKYRRIVEPHLKTIEGLEDPKPLFDRFGSLPIFKKQADNFRIILQEVTVDIGDLQYSVFCVRMVLPRGSNEYNTFHFAPNVRRWLDSNPINASEDKQIKKWLQEEIEKERKSQQLPELTEGLKSWLGIADMYLANATIYETQEWTESILSRDIYDFKETICNGILDLQALGESSNWEKEGSRDVRLKRLEHQLYILFEKIDIGNQNPILILYKIFRGVQPTEEEIEQIKRNYQYDNTNLSKDVLIRNAKRAYPDYILIDPQLWFRIQEDSVANLALSPEEESLLQSATFPMFINGQAGSGKSTMLFYLFAHFCSMHKNRDLKPIFLTYNKRLLDTARKSVISILKNHPNYSELSVQTEEVENFFHPFQDFILQKLVSNNDKHLFSSDKYVSFNKFKQCFLSNYAQSNLNCQLPNRRNYSPELVWHIIRTYIKGYSFDNNFTPDTYKSLPKKDRSVSNEKYADVFNTIWKKWYSKFNTDFELWDDQDLIRYVLKKNLEAKDFPQFSVIFCDEAQDFTKIEIELLLNLSVFTKYNLSHCSNIPFSFAGDPYQTINPTGFRWESLKNIFNERFEKLNPKGLSIRFEPLSQNYRSKPAIIKFSNLIQGFRYKFLNIQELRPQSAWQKFEGVSPCIFIINQDITVNNLIGVADKTILLIPTDSDENKEIEYVKNDELLKSFIQLPDNEEIPISNVMSASTSKGLEFDRVILYNFGSVISNTFQKAINGEDLDDSEFIELSHFFNKLYVGLSRARNYLFVLDTQDGYENFWKYFMTTDLLRSEFEKGNYWTENEVSPLIKGVKADIDNIKEENPLKVAKELEESGMVQGNYSLLQRAQQYYQLENLDQEAIRCGAWAFWFREKWADAGNSFREIQDINQASKAFWRGQNWQSIKDLFNLQDASNLHLLIAKYMLGEIEILSFLSNEAFLDDCDINNQTWNVVISKIQKEFEQIIANDYSNHANFAQKIAAKGFKQFYNFAGNFYFKDKSYENAIKYWDRNEYKEHVDYYNAKLELAQEINDKIFWLQKLKQDDKIVTLDFQNASNLNTESLNIIFGAVIRKNEFDKAIAFEGIALQAKVKRLLENFNSSEQKQKIFDFLLKKEEEGLKILKENVKVFQDFFANKDAIRLILKQVNWKDLLDELDKELRSALPGKFIESFVDVVCEEIENENTDRLFYAINLVGELNKRSDKLTENIKIIRSIAYSEITPESFSFDLREKLESFVTRCVWEKTGWRDDMNFKEIGTALERLGAKSITLQDEIYEYIIKYEPEFSDWAKIRWIKVAQRRIEYEKGQKRFGFVKKIEDDIKGKFDEWKLNLSLVNAEPKYPILNEKKTIPFLFKNLKIYGFPEKPKTDERRNRVTLELSSYEIRINCTSKLVSIEDYSTNMTVDVDLQNNQVGGLAITKTGNHFSFGGKYSGEVMENQKLKLEIENLTLTIEIA